MLRDTQNLWKVDSSADGSWRLTYYQGTESFDCGTPTRTDTPLALVLEFIEYNAKQDDLVAVCGALYQVGPPTGRA